MRAGKLDRRISLQRKTAVPDPDTNENIETWTSYLTGVPASVEYDRGTEQSQGAILSAINYVYFTIRYRPGIKEEDRILFEGRIYDIQFIAEPRRRQEIRITAVYRQGAAV